MVSLLADVNIEGHIAILVSHMQGPYWGDYWDHLQIKTFRFGDVGLAASDSDDRVWEVCQNLRLLLLTNNRNDDGPSSLEATIRAKNSSTSLPVLTFSNAELILYSRDYRERAIESLFDFLLRIDTLLGTGRLFIP